MEITGIEKTGVVLLGQRTSPDDNPQHGRGVCPSRTQPWSRAGGADSIQPAGEYIGIRLRDDAHVSDSALRRGSRVGYDQSYLSIAPRLCVLGPRPVCEGLDLDETLSAASRHTRFPAAYAYFVQLSRGSAAGACGLSVKLL